jgi:hypothetical protein
VRTARGLPFGTRRAYGPVEDLPMRFIADSIFLMLFFVLGICWLIAWAAFHVAGGGIHLLLVVAVIFLIVHFVRGRQSV